MAIRKSTGLVNKMMDTGSFKAIFELSPGCEIAIYSGSQPAAADDAPSGTLLVVLSDNSTGDPLDFETSATAGALAKASAQTWSGTAVASGTAGWFRLRMTNDTDLSSTTLPRYDGACATSGAQMTLGSLTISASAPISVSSAAFTLPKSA